MKYYQSSDNLVSRVKPYQVASDFIVLWGHPGDEETIGADSAEDLQIVWWQQSQIDFFRDRGAGVFLWVLEPLYLCHK